MINDDVIVLQQAADDLLAGKAFYEQQLSGAGDYFWDSLLADIESLKLYGGIHAKHFGLHRYLCRRFPFGIYYEVVEKVVYVIAVLPMKSDPESLLEKIKTRS